MHVHIFETARLISFTTGLTEPTGNCTAGYYCSLGAVFANPMAQAYGDVCPGGYYCPEGTGDPLPCPAGTYLPDTGHDELSDCIACDGGKFCERQGQTNVTDNCTEGYYCESAASVATPTDGVTGDICPTGHYCPTGTTLPIPCADGYYMNLTLAPLCEVCPPRYYCVNASDRSVLWSRAACVHGFSLICFVEFPLLNLPR